MIDRQGKTTAHNDEEIDDCLKDILRYIDAEKFPHAKQDTIIILRSIVLSAKLDLMRELYNEKD